MSRSAKPAPSGVWNSSAACDEVDQDIGLRWPAPARIAAFLCDGFVERCDAASGFLQLRPQRLEGGAIIALERSEAFEHVRREGGTGIGARPLDETI